MSLKFPLFYAPDIRADQSDYLLNNEETHHARHVLRMRAGDQLYLSDGQGFFYLASIQEASGKTCRLDIQNRWEDEQRRLYRLHVAVAPPKNSDRLAWIVEKCTEIGVDRISFLRCERSERKHIKLERLQKIAIGAMKQSFTAFLPRLEELETFSEFITKDIEETQKFIAYLPDESPAHLATQLDTKASYCVLIGPEGDFSPSEVEQALKNNYKPASLGAVRLRTETAAIVTCHTLQLLHEIQS